MAKIKAYISELTARDLANGDASLCRISTAKSRIRCVEVTFELPTSFFEPKKKEGSDK